MKELTKEEIFIQELKILKNNIKRKNFFNSSEFFEKLDILLNNYNCKFGFQNSSSKKHGHLKMKVNRITKEKVLELRIEKNENLEGKIYTIIHELTHLINNHLMDKELTSKQKEVVADTVGIMFINHYNLYEGLEISNLNKKWDVDKYSENYINNMTFSKKRKVIIIKQIIKTYDYLIEYFN